jgi:hypothetical protein
VKAPLAAQRAGTGTTGDATAGEHEIVCNGDGGTMVCYALRLFGGTRSGSANRLV